jgi:UDP-N-acetylglucosamine 4,6-dehydratase/5-epimerase
MLNDATILITGGSGSFGNKFVEMTLARFNPKKIIVFCRDEMKQWEMGNKYSTDGRVRFFIGDVRDKERLYRACSGVDYIIHAAAGKIVPTAEYNPFEYIKTNINGAMNVIDCAIDQKVKRVVALSTDKACNPVNLYGATKLCSDKLFISGSNYIGTQDTRFAIVRYGNVLGSRGSIIPFFQAKAATGVIPVTDARMTRFLITLDKAVKMVWHALEDCKGGEVYVRKCPSMKITEMASAIAPGVRQEMVGIRPGEKLHEIMISVEDARYTYEYETHYKILPIINDWHLDPERRAGGKLCVEGFSYTSDTNTEWMPREELADWLKQQYPHEKH